MTLRTHVGPWILCAALLGASPARASDRDPGTGDAPTTDPSATTTRDGTLDGGVIVVEPVDPDLRLRPIERLYVTYEYKGRISVFDPATHAESTIWEPDAEAFDSVVASPKHGRIYGSSPTTGQVYAYDIGTYARVDQVALPPWADGEPARPATLALEPGEGLLYVGDRKAPVVHVADAGDLGTAVEDFLAYNVGAVDTMAFRPGSLDLTYGGFSSHRLGVRSPHIDPQTLKLWYDWSWMEFGMQGGPEIQGTIGFDWVRTDQLVVVGNAQADTLLVIDPATGGAMGWTDTAAMPMRLGADPLRGKDEPAMIYVPTGQGWTLDVYSVQPAPGAPKPTLEARIEDVCRVGVPDAPIDSPSEVVFSALERRAYVLCGDRIQVVDTTNVTVVDTIPFADGLSGYDIAIAAH